MDADAPKLNVTLYQPNQPPSTLTLTEKTITMGRATDCTIPIRDRFLSRQHAEIKLVGDEWFLSDKGSANGTFVNGVRVDQPVRVGSGDRIALGDSEVLVGDEAPKTEPPPAFSVSDFHSGTSISIPVIDIATEEKDLTKTSERLRILNRLAMELLEDKPMAELFDFIIDKVMQLLTPSRAALAILAPDGHSFLDVKVRRSDSSDTKDLAISRTLLREVVDGRKVLSFTDVSQDEALAQAKSIIGQSIRSALCAPLIVDDKVMGVLYTDYLITQRTISEEDAKLAAQIARVAARKLETTRLREEAVVKQKMDEELKTAYVIQSRLLPAEPPKVEGFRFAGRNRPARTVSGDYFDFVTRPDGRVYFIIADVSGKGITAALVMASVATAFSIFTKDDPTPAQLMTSLNQTLAPKTAPTKFVTVLLGVLDPRTGVVQYANAGHTPPLVIKKDSVEVLSQTDMVVGLFPQAQYRDQSLELAPGEALLAFTDGVIEAENEAGEEMGHEAVEALVNGWADRDAERILGDLETAVLDYAGSTPLGDDVTVLSLSRG